MAEEFLTEIYNYSIILDKVNSFVNRLYADSVMRVHSAKVMEEIIPTLVEACKALVANNDISGQVMYEALERLNTYHTGIEIADELSINVVPNLMKLMESFPEIDVTDEEGIRIKSTKTGLLTLIDSDRNIAYHSLNDPMKEAQKKAELLYNPSIGNYVFFGCGLGYLPYQLSLISDESVRISLLFSSRKNYEYAVSYGVLDYINSEKTDIYCLDGNDAVGEFLKLISKENTEYYICRFEMNSLSSEDAEAMDVFLSRQNTLFNSKPYIINNFPCNLRNVNKFISSFDKSKLKKKIAVIAGGPSVDDNIDFIKNNRDDFSIICVGTIYKRLLKEGIIPEIVTIIDPFPTTVPQVTYTSDTGTALFVGMDTYWQVADIYPGEKYILAMEDDIGRQKEYADRFKEYVFPNCSTVTTIAYYIAKYFEAEEIMLIGADYAFPNGVTHAAGTDRKININTEGMISVPCVTGGTVYSTNKMIDYKNEIEEAIKTCNIKTKNLSRIGARIEGCV